MTTIANALPLFDPGEHEPLTEEAWDETAAHAFVERIVRDADNAFDADAFWPLHPEDRYAEEPGGYRGVYCGAAGTMWALHRLASDNGVALRNDYAAAIVRCEEQYRSNPWETQNAVPGYFLGTTGIMTARYAITGDTAVCHRLEGEIRSNVHNATQEAFWGASGSAIAALLVRERDGDRQFDGVLREIQDALWETWPPADASPCPLLWEQDLYGRRCRYVGVGHGAVGNIVPFVRALDLLTPERQGELHARIVALLEHYALRDERGVNWISLGEPQMGNRLQWCHGGPGAIVALGSYPSSEPRIEALLRAAGEAIWCAGPLKKGPTLCHGTAGNGYALLRLAHRTQEDIWRERARTFAMHAIRQVFAWRENYGMPAFSLWTGELGVALFVDALLRNDPLLLSFDLL